MCRGSEAGDVCCSEVMVHWRLKRMEFGRSRGVHSRSSVEMTAFVSDTGVLLRKSSGDLMRFMIRLLVTF